MAIVLCIIVPHFLSLQANVRVRLLCCVCWYWEHCVHIPGESVGKGAAVNVCCCPMQLGLGPVHKHCKSLETVKGTGRQDHGAVCDQPSTDWLKSWKSDFFRWNWLAFVWSGSVLGRHTKCTFHDLFKSLSFLYPFQELCFFIIVFVVPHVKIIQ